MPETSDNTADSLIRGGDISTLSALEAAGKSFSDATGARPDLAKQMGFIGGKLPLHHGPAEGEEGLAKNIAALADMRAMVARLPVARLQEISSIYGHDAFLKETEQLRRIFTVALESVS